LMGYIFSIAYAAMNNTFATIGSPRFFSIAYAAMNEWLALRARHYTFSIAYAAMNRAPTFFTTP